MQNFDCVSLDCVEKKLLYNCIKTISQICKNLHKTENLRYSHVLLILIVVGKV